MRTGLSSRMILTVLTRPPRATHSRQTDPPHATIIAWTGHSQISRSWLATPQYRRYRLAGVTPHSVTGAVMALHGHIRDMPRSAVATLISIFAISHLTGEADSSRTSSGYGLERVAYGWRTSGGQEE